MSSLLIPCEPLQVLPSLAKAIGLNEAIFLQQLHYWLQRSNNEHDGRVWVYNTYDEWQAQFPFWSLDTMQRIAKKLVKSGLLVVHQFNKQNWDRRNWYSIDYEKLATVEAEHGLLSESRKLRSSIPADCGSLESRKLRSSYKDQETTKKPSLSPLSTKRGYKPPEPDVTIAPPFNGKEFLSALSQYESVKKEIKSPLTPTSREALYCKLAKFDEETATIALAEAAAGGYKGVFPEKVNGKSRENGKHSIEPDRPVWMACKKKMLPDGTWVDDK